MEDTNRVYRIRTTVGEDAPNVIHVPLKQSYDMFEILSLKLDQTNSYKTYESDYGVIVGRVTANGGFGVPNAKVSIFIEVSDDDALKDRLLYNFTSTSDTDNNGVRYNLLPDYVDDACHQDVGTFPNKRLVLDNNDIIEMFDKYWKYTTTTNHAGDYMLFGIPTGSQQLHVDVDLSDCGILSQRPRDMIGKGYNANMFESPNKFKSSTNLNSLAQIISQDRGLYVYPYWGDVSDGDDKFSITRCDINLEYKFESYAVFMGSIVTDKGSNAIGKNCTGTEQNGKMSDLIAGEGTIEMIRKTIDGKVEEFPIMGNRLIDGDGVWCYQIPMNLDYVTTDEFGNLVPTDNPDKGIATRTRVRFRISLDENPNDATARKRARYLVPNNPRLGEGEFDETLEADYEFGSATREESYCDMFWNKVYTVKNYIPKLQKNSKETNRKHTGIKLINHYGDNNPMPYNALTIKLSFTYRIICVITKVIINLIEFINQLLSIVSAILCLLIKVIQLPGEILGTLFAWIPFGIGKKIKRTIKKGWNKLTSPVTKLVYKIMPNCIGLSSEFCDDGINQVTYYPGCGYFLFSLFKLSSIGLDCIWEETKKNHTKNQLKICENEKKSPEDCEMSLTEPSNATAMLYNCIENQLAQQNDATSFNFYNDWVNGVLYAPLWYRKITPKKRYFFGLFKKKAKDDWCSSQREYPGMRILQHCVVKREKDGTYANFDGTDVYYMRIQGYDCKGKCHKQYTEVKGMNGVIHSQQTMLGQTVYYYKAVEYDASLPKNRYVSSQKNGDIKFMFATDIVLLGSLNECDTQGIPQFFKSLESTTYNMPTDILFTDYDFILTVNDTTGESERMEYTITDLVKTSEMAGCDWGNPNEFDKYDGGLFYSIGCSSAGIKLDTKSCVNLSRVCEYGVSLDETKEVADLEKLEEASDEQIDVDSKYFQRLITDGFISWDELYNLDERSMFATLNGNKLHTKLNNKNGLYEYDFRYLYPENFDGSLKEIMEQRTKRYSEDVNYKNNYKLEEKSRDYYIFRMGNKPYYYDKNFSFPRYENSFYFYFGLKAGKTAIEKFNSKYFAECINENVENQISVKFKANSWCSMIDNNQNDGYLALDFTSVATPYSLLINGVSNGDYSIEINDITEEKIIFINDVGKKPSSLSEYVQLKGEYDDESDIWDYKSDGITIPMMDNGSYQAVLTDDEGNITEFTFNILGTYLSYKLNTNNFEQPNNVLMEMFDNDYNRIASDKENSHTEDDEYKSYNREIGGVVTIYDIFMNGEKLDSYKLTLEAKYGTPLSNSDYTGVDLIYNNGSITYIKGQPTLMIPDVQSSMEHYAFGLPKGRAEYTVTITELCNGIESGNSISKDFFVDEPIPYKMYINDIDYDVIKHFDNYTGWNLSGSISSHGASEGTLNMSNPWFKTDNIYYNENLITSIENNLINEFIVEKDDNTFQIYAVLEDGRKLLLDTPTRLRDEFCTNNKGQNDVYYNWVDDYIVNDENINWSDSNDVYEKIDQFITDVNRVFNLRKELREMMKDTFFLNCEDDSKTILVRGKTDKLPCTQTIVYHPEKAVEYENYNVLDGNSLIDEDINEITDIRIPTISYRSSEKYGDGTDNDAPCLVTVENNKKKPYSCGIMNNSGISIPKKDNGQPFDFVERDNAKYINHSSTQHNDLFSFPIIDKILTTDYIAWSAFVNLPQYGYDNNGNPRVNIINMNGLLAGIVFNGNVVNNRFATQTLNDIDLLLSNNICDETTTYIEKRVFLGYNYGEVGRWVISFLRNISNNITSETINALNRILPISITEENIGNIFNSLTVDGENIKYQNTSINIQTLISNILSFTYYTTLNESSLANYKQQYSFVLPTETVLVLEDENQCGVNYPIDGTMAVKLSSNSVNDCRAGGQKILEIETDGDVYYSIFKTDINGTGYPLNLCENSGILWQIPNRIYGIYSQSQSQNLFSYQMKSKYFRGEGNLIDKNFKSQVAIETEGEEEQFEDTKGYGTTGKFVPDETFSYPVFIVGEDDTNVRALSPVYDYSNVLALVKFGILERKESVQTDGDTEGAETTTEIQTIKDYKFGVAIKKSDNDYQQQFYLDNYEYTLSAICNVDSINRIEVSQGTLFAPGQFLFTTITEALYKTLKSKMNPFGLLQLIPNTTVTAFDYTNLKHICGIKMEDFEETKWYTISWYANISDNLPANEANGGILYKQNYFDYIEFNYEEGDEVEPMNCEPGKTLGFAFLGWSENEPNKNAIVTPITTATESKIYFANWDIPLPKIIVRFLDSDGTTVLETQQIEEGGVTNGPTDTSLSEYSWYLSSDATQSEVEFPQTIVQPTDYIKVKEFTVNWYDTDDTLEPPKFTVHFRLTENDTQDMDTQEITAGEKVSLRGECVNYTWYVMGDTEKKQVQFPYTVNGDITFIAHKKYNVKWVDNGEQIPPSGQEEDVYVFESISPTQTTIAYNVSYTDFVIKTTLNGYLHNFTATVTQGEDWLSVDNIGSADAQNGTLTLKVMSYANTNHEDRTGILTLVQDDSNNAITLQITQEGLPQTDGIINVRVKNSRTSGVPIESAQITFKVNGADIIASVGGGITSGYDRVTSITINESQKTEDIIADTVYIYPHSLSANFRQTPNPYVYNTVGQEGGIELFIEILDGESVPYDASCFELYPEFSDHKSGFMEPRISGNSYTIPTSLFMSNFGFFIRAKQQNTGGVTITSRYKKNDFAFMIDDYGYGFFRNIGYNKYAGDNSTSIQAENTITFTPNNTDLSPKSISTYSELDEKRTTFSDGLFYNRLIRVPASGLNGTLVIKFFPLSFESSFLYTPTSVYLIDGSQVGETINNELVRNVTYSELNLNNNNTFVNLQMSDNSIQETDYNYYIPANTTGQYRYVHFSFSRGSATYGAHVTFVQEPYSTNRIYYGNVPFEPKYWYEYVKNPSDNLKYHVYFQFANSEIITSSKEISALSADNVNNTTYYGFAKTNVLCVPSNLAHTITPSISSSDIIANNYMWGDQSYIIYKLASSSDTTYTLNID